MYIKPRDKSYTEMFIYIDEHFYEEDSDKNLMFEYMFHLAKMFAGKFRAKLKTNNVDDFAIFLATRVYFRYINPKQYQYNEDGTAKMAKVKSVKNYMETVFMPVKIDYDKINTPTLSDENSAFESSARLLRDTLIDNSDEIEYMDWYLSLDSIVEVVKTGLTGIIYKDYIEYNYIYISCLLTLLDMMTLPIDALEDNKEYSDVQIVKKYSKNIKDSKVILYNLPESMANYILTLVNRAKYILSTELSSRGNSYIDNDSVIDNVLWEELNELKGVNIIDEVGT